MAIHGSPGGFDQGLVWARHLRDGGCELIAPSRPGYLRTPLDSGRSPAQQADLYAAMLDALHINKVTVLGISSGGPSAVHFAARHPNRTDALLLDAAVLLPIAPATNALERVIFESAIGTWLSCQIAKKRPKLTAALVVDSLSAGLSKDRKRDAVGWITSNPARLHDVAALPTSLAPRRFREAGQRNDESNETNLAPLPFADVTAPTLIAQGTNDAFPLIDHATHAAEKMHAAELMLVDGGHHGLPWCRHIGPVTQRQLELSLA
ncbi:MAG: alpha/beta hydrolase [Acidimicrobiales bacterium]|nr:alpha/beta hydrolase [Acidimicrobiales bacterium]